MNNFTVVRRGYSTEEVDAYVSQLEAALALKNQQLKEYQAKESAINSSIVSAELFAESMRTQAEEDAAEIRKTALAEASAVRVCAEEDAESIRTSTRLNLASLREQALAMHSKLEEFQDHFGRILQDYLVSLRTNDLANIFAGTEAFINAMEMPNKNAEPAPEAVFAETEDDLLEEAPEEEDEDEPVVIFDTDLLTGEPAAFVVEELEEEEEEIEEAIEDIKDNADIAADIADAVDAAEDFLAGAEILTDETPLELM